MHKFMYGWGPAGLAQISGLGLGLLGGAGSGRLTDWPALIGAQ